MALKENMTRITVNIDKDKYEKVKEMAMNKETCYIVYCICTC